MTLFTESTALQAQISSLFSNPNGDSATALVKLINDEIGSEGYKQSTKNLDFLLSSVTSQLLQSSESHRETIDEYIEFVLFAALQINNEATHIGTIDAPKEYKQAPLHPASGPAIVGERIAKDLADQLWDTTSRCVTPDDGYDRGRSKEYYFKTALRATILARGFALSQSFRDSFWRVIEDILIKALFSGDGEPEPGGFVALTAILLGAGKEIKEYMSDEGKKGTGKDWVWYDDKKSKEDERWGWDEVVEALKEQPGPIMKDRLPAYVKDNIELAKKHAMKPTVGESWDSEKLAAVAFRWASLDS